MIDDIINIVQIVLIAIITIMCLVACYRIYQYSHLSYKCVRLAGGDINVKTSIDKIKALKSKLSIYRKPLVYFASGVDTKFNDTCYKLLTNISGVKLPIESLTIFAKLLGASGMREFITTCTQMFTNSKTIIEDVQTFTSEFVPTISAKLHDMNYINTLVNSNKSDIKFICDVAVREHWMSEKIASTIMNL